MGTKPFSTNLSDILVNNNVVDAETLKTAEQEANEAGVRLERYLVDKDIVPGAEITLALSEYLKMPPITLAHFTPDTQLLDLIPRAAIKKHQVVPLAKTAKTLTIALADPFDIVALDELHTATGLDITPVVASEEEVRELLNRTVAEEASSLDMEDIMSQADDDGGVQVGTQDDGDKQSLEEMMEGAEDAPVIRMVNMILIEGLRLGSNDVHIEPQEDYVRLRYRIDGVLIERPNLQKSLQAAITSRVKIMADLDIGEQRVPQDGRFRITALGKKIDVRVSILPTIFGGKVVMRLLDKGALFPNLASLGLEEHALQAMTYAIAQPHGIILVTGPTGSGKTTTLYSCLQDLNKPDVNVVTCEDPVEYQLQGVNQVRIHTDVGMTFSAALRAILRQDPDIVLIGEIRDAETCEIAIKAALTGHLVLSTLHTNDASGAVTRLVDMGIEPFLLASSLILTQAQRLYRKLCPTCKKPTTLPMELVKEHNVDPDFFKGEKIYGPHGCPKCQNIGFRGRAAVMEVLPIDDDIRTLILRQAIAAELRDKAEENGMVTLRTGALVTVKQGLTNLETAIKITVGDE